MAAARGPRRRAGQVREKHETPIGASTARGSIRLRSYQVGAWPLLNHDYERLKLTEILERHLPADDVRQQIPTARSVELLIRHVRASRQPLDAIPEWVARHGPELLDLFQADIPGLHDDRLGACLARLFQAATPPLLLAIVRSAIDEFDVSLDELHNDSTSVSFYGLDSTAQRPLRQRGRVQPAITWGHSQDHRPDLQQRLFTLTRANDGGVPLYFQVDCGNTREDVTHGRSGDLLASREGFALAARSATALDAELADR